MLHTRTFIQLSHGLFVVPSGTRQMASLRRPTPTSRRSLRFRLFL